MTVLLVPNTYDGVVSPEHLLCLRTERDCSCMEDRLQGMMDGFHAYIQPDKNGEEFEVFCSQMDGKLWTVSILTDYESFRQ